MPLTEKVLRNVRKAELREKINYFEAKKISLWHRYCQLKAKAEGLRAEYKKLELEEAVEKLVEKQKAGALKKLRRLEKKENITITKEVLEELMKEL